MPDLQDLIGEIPKGNRGRQDLSDLVGEIPKRQIPQLQPLPPGMAPQFEQPQMGMTTAPALSTGVEQPPIPFVSAPEFRAAEGIPTRELTPKEEKTITEEWWKEKPGRKPRKDWEKKSLDVGFDIALWTALSLSTGGGAAPGLLKSLGGKGLIRLLPKTLATGAKVGATYGFIKSYLEQLLEDKGYVPNKEVAKQVVTNALYAAALYGTGLAAKGIHQKLTKELIIKLGKPLTVTLTKTDIKAIHGLGGKGTEITAMPGYSKVVRQIMKTGAPQDITITPETLAKVVDKPWWKVIKTKLGIKPFEWAIPTHDIKMELARKALPSEGRYMPVPYQKAKPPFQPKVGMPPGFGVKPPPYAPLEAKGIPKEIELMREWEPAFKQIEKQQAKVGPGVTPPTFKPTGWLRKFQAPETYPKLKGLAVFDLDKGRLLLPSELGRIANLPAGISHEELIGANQLGKGNLQEDYAESPRITVESPKQISMRMDEDNYLTKTGILSEEERFDNLFNAARALKKVGVPSNVRLNIPEIKYHNTLGQFITPKTPPTFKSTGAAGEVVKPTVPPQPELFAYEITDNRGNSFISKTPVKVGDKVSGSLYVIKVKKIPAEQVRPIIGFGGAKVGTGVTPLTFKPIGAAGEVMKPKVAKGARAYLNEKIDYGGTIRTRGSVIKELQKKGITQKNIDAYMAGQAKAIEFEEKPSPQPKLGLEKKALIDISEVSIGDATKANLVPIDKKPTSYTGEWLILKHPKTNKLYRTYVTSAKAEEFLKARKLEMPTAKVNILSEDKSLLDKISPTVESFIKKAADAGYTVNIIPRGVKQMGKAYAYVGRGMEDRPFDIYVSPKSLKEFNETVLHEALHQIEGEKWNSPLAKTIRKEWKILLGKSPKESKAMGFVDPLWNLRKGKRELLPELGEDYLYRPTELKKKMPAVYDFFNKHIGAYEAEKLGRPTATVTPAEKEALKGAPPKEEYPSRIKATDTQIPFRVEFTGDYIGVTKRGGVYRLDSHNKITGVPIAKRVGGKWMSGISRYKKELNWSAHDMETLNMAWKEIGAKAEKVAKPAPKPAPIPKWENLTPEQQKFMQEKGLGTKIYIERIYSPEDRKILAGYLEQFERLRGVEQDVRKDLLRVLKEKPLSSRELEYKMGLEALSPVSERFSAFTRTFGEMIEKGEIKKVKDKYRLVRKLPMGPPIKEAKGIPKSIIAKPAEILHRGIYSPKIQGGNYFSTSREFARDFTKSGLDSEIQSVVIPKNRILNLGEKTPFALDEKSIDSAKTIAKKQGYSAFYVDEGLKQPKSVFVIDKKIITSAQDFYYTQAVKGVRPEAVKALPKGLIAEPDAIEILAKEARKFKQYSDRVDVALAQKMEQIHPQSPFSFLNLLKWEGFATTKSFWQAAQRGKVAPTGKLVGVYKITGETEVIDINKKKIKLRIGDEYRVYRLPNNNLQLTDGEQVTVETNQLKRIHGKKLDVGEMKAGGIVHPSEGEDPLFRKKQKFIHMWIREENYPEERYRDILRKATGVESTKDMTPEQMDKAYYAIARVLNKKGPWMPKLETTYYTPVQKMESTGEMVLDYRFHTFGKAELQKESELLHKRVKPSDKPYKIGFFRSTGWNLADVMADIENKVGLPAFQLADKLIHGYQLVEYKTSMEEAVEDPLIMKVTETDRDEITKALEGKLHHLSDDGEKLAQHFRQWYDKNKFDIKKSRFIEQYEGKGKIPNLKQEKFDELVKIFETEGEEALDKAIAKTDFGVIFRFYSPQKLKRYDITLPKPKYPSKSWLRTRKARTEQVEYLTDAVEIWRKTVRGLNRIKYIQENLGEFRSMLNDPKLDRVAASYLNAWADVIAGFPLPSSHLGRFANWGISSIIRTSLTQPVKWVRNWPQRFFLLGYTRTPDWPKTLYRIIRHTAPPKFNSQNPEAKVFTQYTSQLEAIEREFLESQKKIWIDKMPVIGRMLRIMEPVYPGIDNGSRWSNYSTIIKNINDALKTNEPFVKLKNRIYWDYLPIPLRQKLLTELDMGNKEYFARRIAEEITGARTQFLYRLTQKTLAESKTELGRVGMRVMAFTRQFIGNMVKDGNLLIRGKTLGERKSGARALIFRIVLSFLIEEALRKIWGEPRSKRYGFGYKLSQIMEVDFFGIGKTAFDWVASPVPPIMTVITSTGEACRRYAVAQATGEEPSLDDLTKAIDKAAQSLVKQADSFTLSTIPFLRQSIFIMEALVGAKKMKPLMLAYKTIIEKNGWDYETVERTTLDKIRHAMAGTEKKQLKKPPRKIPLRPIRPIRPKRAIGGY